MNQAENLFSENYSLSDLNAMSKGSMVEFLSIEFTEIGIDYLKAKMPVNEKTKQPFGMLHGGASVVLAETVGSVASNLVLGGEKLAAGLEVNANHIRPVSSGHVHATAKKVHIGKQTHVWSIEIENDEGKMVCVSRLTVAVIDKK